MSDLVGNPEDRFSQNEVYLFAITVAVCICTTNGQPGGAGPTFNTTEISNVQTDILNGYLVNTRPSDSMEIFIGFGVQHITQLVYM